MEEINRRRKKLVIERTKRRYDIYKKFSNKELLEEIKRYDKRRFF